MIVDLGRKWLHRARCRGQGTDVFFADHGVKLPGSVDKASRNVQRHWAVAEEFCLGCPVMTECARDFLGEPEGVYGGMNPIDRRQRMFEHSVMVSNLPEGPKLREYVALAVHLSSMPRVTIQDVQRIMGLRQSTVTHLKELHEKALKEAERARKRAEKEAKAAREAVGSPEPSWPTSPPSDGDGWVRYGRSVIRGYYLGETEDGAWFHVKVPLSKEYSMAWFKRHDVRWTRRPHPCIQQRVGSPSRIYGTPINGHSPKPS